ncbi:hypothetical protein B0H13DRAFT_2339793 [Mycena leptocephala]|nr:hypothetical protein B0H13DRAFT_2339793 [Mycena leptocephala]
MSAGLTMIIMSGSRLLLASRSCWRLPLVSISRQSPVVLVGVSLAALACLIARHLALIGVSASSFRRFSLHHPGSYPGFSFSRSGVLLIIQALAYWSTVAALARVHISPRLLSSPTS